MKNTILKSAKTLLLSIKPRYSSRIFDGEKIIELRRVRPRISRGSFILIYESSPTMALVGFGCVAEVIEAEPKALWKKVEDEAGITKTEFVEYFRGAALGFGIKFNKVWSFNEPVSLPTLRSVLLNFQPPQTYRYLSRAEVTAVWSTCDLCARSI